MKHLLHNIEKVFDAPNADKHKLKRNILNIATTKMVINLENKFIYRHNTATHLTHKGQSCKTRKGDGKRQVLRRQVFT